MRRARPIAIRPVRVSGRRHIRADEIERLVREIRTWNHARAALSWRGVVDLAEGLFAHRWTRQALENHGPIKDAFQEAKAGGSRKKARQPRDAALASYEKRIEALQEEIRDLRAKIAAYQERLARYVVNAALRNVTEADLEAKLPPNDRGQTDPRLKGGV